MGKISRTEYNKRDAELSEKIRELATMKWQLEQQYISGLHFKIGDKVLIDNKETKPIIGWVTDIRVSTLDCVDIRYNPPRKDDLRSEQNRRIVTEPKFVTVMNDYDDTDE